MIFMFFTIFYFFSSLFAQTGDSGVPSAVQGEGYAEPVEEVLIDFSVIDMGSLIEDSDEEISMRNDPRRTAFRANRGRSEDR